MIVRPEFGRSWSIATFTLSQKTIGTFAENC